MIKYRRPSKQAAKTVILALEGDQIVKGSIPLNQHPDWCKSRNATYDQELFGPVGYGCSWLENETEAMQVRPMILLYTAWVVSGLHSNPERGRAHRRSVTPNECFHFNQRQTLRLNFVRWNQGINSDMGGNLSKTGNS